MRLTTPYLYPLRIRTYILDRGEETLAQVQLYRDLSAFGMSQSQLSTIDENPSQTSQASLTYLNSIWEIPVGRIQSTTLVIYLPSLSRTRT